MEPQVRQDNWVHQESRVRQDQWVHKDPWVSQDQWVHKDPWVSQVYRARYAIRTAPLEDVPRPGPALEPATADMGKHPATSANVQFDLCLRQLLNIIFPTS